MASGTGAATQSGLRIANDVLGLIGRTPMVKLAGLNESGAELWAKVEFLSPGGSVKDRTALSMILDAEQSGKLGAGSTVIEATSGNTGISLAMIAAVRRYRCVIVMPEDMSIERRRALKAYGAEVELTPAGRGMAGAVERAKELCAATAGGFMPAQFTNEANPRIHEETTAREIIEQTGGKVAAFVAGVGTGGTLTGVGRVLKRELGSHVKVVGVEPAGSAVLSGGVPGPHALQGLGAGFVPETLDMELLDQIVRVQDATAQRMVERLAREYGLLVGISAGANVAAAAGVAARSSGGGTVVTILSDSGERYLS